MVLLAFRPLPPMLSATLPVKLAGTALVLKELPADGVATRAVVGITVSLLPTTVTDDAPGGWRPIALVWKYCWRRR